MECNNDYKLRNLKSISLRNLYFPPKVNQETNGKITEITIISPRKEEVIGRRKSLFPSIPQFDELTSNELLQMNTFKLVDSFFTLHVRYRNEELLVYVSEKILSNMNPNFSQIQLPTLPNCNSLVFALKIWCKKIQDCQWVLFYKYDIDLKNLWYIGDSLVDTENFFHANSVIFNLNNRFYTTSDSLTVNRDAMVYKPNGVDSKHILPSYSFDLIRSLNSILRSLKELMESKNRISMKVNESIDSLNDVSNSGNLMTQQERLSIENGKLDKYIERQESINDTIMSHVMSKRVQISRMKQTINEMLPSKIEMITNHLEVIESQIEPIYESLRKLIYPSIAQNLQETIYILKELICIENVNNSIKFTIMGLEFPLSIKELLDICYYNKYDLHNYNIGTVTYASEKESHQMKTNQINAGLNYIIQLLNSISIITNINLKYKMVSNGNLCYVLNPISNDSNQKITKYPLHYDQEQTSKSPLDQQDPSGRKFNLQNKSFEIGLDLLNKNLVSLINEVTNTYNTYYLTIKNSQISNNIPIDCLDNFLWNLQYLVLFITAPTSTTSA